MQEVATDVTREQFDRWVEEGQRLIAQLPGLFTEKDRLFDAVSAAEKERESAQRDLAQAEAENRALRGEYTQMQEAFSKFMNDIQQLMAEVVRKLNAPAGRSPFQR